MAETPRGRAGFPAFAARNLRIRTKDGAIAPFRLNRVQRALHARLEAQRAATGRVRALVLKARQPGVSTYVEGRFYWLVTRRRGVRAFILTHLRDATEAIFEMVERFHAHNPAARKPHVGASNAKELQFDELDNIHVRCDHDQPQSATAFWLSGTNDSNVNYCTFRSCRAIHDDGQGFYIDNADSNLFMHTFSYTTGTGYGIYLDGSPDAGNPNISARANTFINVQLVGLSGGTGGVRVKAGATTSGNANWNVMYGYSTQNSAGAIVVDDGVLFNAYKDQYFDVRDNNSPELRFYRDAAYLTAASVGSFRAFGKLGSGTLQEFGSVKSIQTGGAGTEVSRMDINTYRYDGGGLKRRLYVGDGVVIEHDQVAPTGGDRGGGTLNLAGPLYLNNIPVQSGAGSPEGAIVAPVGAFYLRTDGGAGTTGYLKESGTGNTGWAAI